MISKSSWFRIPAKGFKALHGILYIIRVIHGSYIPNIALVIGGEDYYFLMGIYATQVVVDSMTSKANFGSIVRFQNHYYLANNMPLTKIIFRI